MATTYEQKLEARNAQLEADLAAVRAQLEEKDSILRDPHKWMKWCDSKILEEIESKEVELQAAEAILSALRERMEAAGPVDSHANSSAD